MSVDQTAAQPDIADSRQNSARRLPFEGRSGERIGQYIGVLASLLVVSLAITLGLVFWSAKTQDSIAVESSRSLAETALTLRKGNLQSTLIDYTYWDEAYENTSKAFSLSWFAENYGDYPYLTDTFGITSTYVVLPGNRVLAHTQDAELHSAPESLELADQTIGLIQLIEGARRTVDNEFPAVSGLVKMDGRLYIAAARIVHPHTDELMEAAGVTPENGTIVVFMAPFDDALMVSLKDDFGFADLKHVASLTETEMLALPLQSIEGQSFGYLVWNIVRPSKHVYTVILPALAAVILSIGALGFYFLRLLRNNQTKLFHAMLDAKAADRAKVQFLSNVSHELRTPLNGVIGIAQILEREELKDDQRKLVGTLLSSANHQLDLIRDLLDVTRIESDRIELDCQPFDLCSVIRETVSLVDHKAKSKGLAVHVSLPENLHCRVIGDPVRVKQICLNLLDNAVKFTDTGSIGIASSARTVGDFEEIRLAVKDTGVGISKEDQTRVFSRFMQVDGSATRNSEGLGLGLPICQALAGAMGGQISLESTPGEGTEFVVSVKLRRAPENAGEALS